MPEQTLANVCVDEPPSSSQKYKVGQKTLSDQNNSSVKKTPLTILERILKNEILG